MAKLLGRIIFEVYLLSNCVYKGCFKLLFIFTFYILLHLKRIAFNRPSSEFSLNNVYSPFVEFRHNNAIKLSMQSQKYV